MRTHYCGLVKEELVDQQVELYGWAHRRRDHGGVIFIDLRDREGWVQVVVNPEQADIFKLAEHVRNEYVLHVKGNVRARPEGMINSEIVTGKVEVVASELEILNASEPLPIQVNEYMPVGEEARLKHRYIDLRRPEIMQRFLFRAKLNKTLRAYLDDEGFTEVETPILTKATPEGARDYLVPSRLQAGAFYALPQSPQVFKQLLMTAGFDRYYQITRCFRDEDLRADRQPEFTQLDIETSFMDEEEIIQIMENMVRHVFKQCMDVELPNPFPRLSYAEAMQRYGSDRPDLRVPLELVDIADLLKDVEFKVFNGPANDAEGRVAAIRVPNACELLTRKQIDDYTKYVSIYGAKGLAYIKVNDLAAGREGLQSPILKFLPDDALTGILERTQAKTGDIIFFGADKANVVNESLGALRVKLGLDCNLLQGQWQPLWVVDFPMFEKTDAGWSAMHHPFTMPTFNKPEDISADPGKCLSRAYDIVLNGSEIGGGSIRIHKHEIQEHVFKALGISQQEAESKFSHLLNSLKYGCPPMGGIAFGLDRMAAMMMEVDSIREVIVFPKTQTGHCPLTDAPAGVSAEQLAELNIKVTQTEKDSVTS